MNSSNEPKHTQKRQESPLKTWRKPLSELGVVLDTNVVVSGIFWDNPSRKILQLWGLEKFRLVTSEPILSELHRILQDFKIKLSLEDRDELLEDMRLCGLLVEPKIPITICEDPDDNKFIETAISGDAQFIVSQDKHLLKIEEFEGIHIVTPKDFLRTLAIK